MNSKQLPVFLPVSSIGHPSAPTAIFTSREQQQQNPVADVVVATPASLNAHTEGVAIAAHTLNPPAASLNPGAAALNPAAASLNPAVARFNPVAASLNPAVSSLPSNNTALNPVVADSSLNHAVAIATSNRTADSLSQLSEALSCMDAEISKIYRMAVTRCPDLVTKESNPISYLEFCKYDPWKAAKRICTYWELRYEIFGPERCFRPVTKYCYETGALSKVAIDAILETGHSVMLLPDYEGRTIVISQRLSRKLHTKYDVQPVHKMEVAFYFMQLVAAQPNAIKKGLRNVFLLNEKRMYPSGYPKWQTAIARVLRDCFPIELVSLHVVIAPRISKRSMTPSYSRRLIDSTVPYVWNAMKSQMGFTRLTLDVIQVSTDDNKVLYEEKLAKLLIDKLKLNPNSVPIQAGGAWSWERFNDWFQMQQNRLLQQGLPTVPVPILPNQRTNKKSEGSRSSSNYYKRVPSQDSYHSSFENASSLNIRRQLDASYLEERSSGTKRKMGPQKMPSVRAMAALGALEPLPIWYGETDTTEQSVVDGTTTARLPEETSKRPRGTI